MTYDSNRHPVDARAPGGTTLAYAGMVGAGAASPTVPTAAQAGVTVPPASVNMATARTGTAAVVVTRTAAGDHTYTFEPFASPTKVYDVQASVPGATVALEVKVRSWTITAGRLAVRVITFIANGTLTDMASGTDFLVLTVHGSVSNAQ